MVRLFCQKLNEVEIKSVPWVLTGNITNFRRCLYHYQPKLSTFDLQFVAVI